MVIKSVGIAALGAFVVLGTSACGLGNDGSETHDSRTFEPPGKALVIDTPNDDIELSTGGDQITVDRWLKGNGKATWEMQGDTLRLETDCGGLMDFGCGARYKIAVPENLKVKVVSSNGDITAKQTAPGFEVDATNGDVHVVDPRGSTSVRTQNGDVDVTLDKANAPYRVELTTTNGDKNSSVESDPRSSHRIRLKTTNGDITVR